MVALLNTTFLAEKPWVRLYQFLMQPIAVRTTVNWLYPSVGDFKCRKTDSEIAFLPVGEDVVFTFDWRQSLWRNEKTGETHLELFLIGKDGFYRLGQEFRDEPSRQKALALTPAVWS